MSFKKTAMCGLLLGILPLGAWVAYVAIYPYGYSHCCDSCLFMALEQYARDHDGRFPSGQPSPEESLSLLYPQYASAELLRGKTVPLRDVETLLKSGRLLGAESCGWHYVEGLTQSDSPNLAIFWDKVGLGHFGERLSSGGHTVVFLTGETRVVTSDEWTRFLDEQKALLAARDDRAVKGIPALSAMVRLPTGEIVDHFDGSWRLEKVNHAPDGTLAGMGTTSGPTLRPATLRWTRSEFREGNTTFVLVCPETRWKSKPITVRVREGKVFPDSIVFEMESQEVAPGNGNIPK